MSRKIRILSWLIVSALLLIGGLISEHHFSELIVAGGIYADEHGTVGNIPPSQMWGWIISVLAIVSSVVIAITIAISVGKNPRSSHRNEDWSTPHE
jgi:uncharacterized membrane protein